MAGQAAYRVSPGDALHGGLLLVAGQAGVTPYLREVCDQFAADGYETIAAPADADLAALLGELPAPRFVLGVQSGADAALALAGRDDRVAGVSALYPLRAPERRPAAPTILHFGKGDRLLDPDVRALAETEPDLPIFAYVSASGFFESTDPAFDPDCARLARLRTLALFRRSAGRGES